MKKSYLFTAIILGCLVFNVTSAQAAPPPPPPHGIHHGGNHVMHRPPMHHGHFHQPPRIHHHHHVRHSRYISPCYYSGYYPIGWSSRVYYPIHYPHLGATFHISL